MVHTITFNLPEESTELRLAINGGNYWAALWALRERIRSLEKYEDKESVTIDELRQIFYDILEDENVNLDEID